MRKLAALAVLTLLTPSMACTLIWTDTVRPLQPPNPPVCRQNWFAPTLDASVAALLTAAAVVNGTDRGLPRGQRQTSAILDGSIALLYAGISVVGFVRSDECRQAYSEYERWSMAHGPLGDVPVEPAMPAVIPPANPTMAAPADEEVLREQAWAQEQERRFAQEHAQFEEEMRDYRAAHPFAQAGLRVSNTGDVGDVRVLAIWQSEESAEHIETLAEQAVPAHQSLLFDRALQRREGLTGRLLLVVCMATGDHVFELMADFYADHVLHAELLFDQTSQDLVLQQAWE